MCIKLIKNENEVEYVNDILNVKVNKSTKTAIITDTVEKEYKITYKNDNTFDKLAKTIDRSLMDSPAVEIYVNEEDFIAVLEAEANNVRKPGESPSIP